jgi:uncharacterized protein (DUF362 family)
VLEEMGVPVKRGDTVLLKPNASFPTPPQWGCTTHPEVVATTAKVFLEAGARKVIVVDHTLRDPKVCFQRNGLKEALRPIPSVRLVGLRRRDFRETEVPSSAILKKVDICRELMEVDVWVNIPTAKSHSETGVSLGLKNLMGLIWDRATFHRDLELDLAIAELAAFLRPTYTIMDGTYALLTGGPGGPGRVQRWDMVIGGRDPLAVDAYTVALGSWYGIKVKPQQVRHLKAARNMGLGTLDLAQIEVVERGG